MKQYLSSILQQYQHKKRIQSLKGTTAYSFPVSQLSSLEFLQLIKHEGEVEWALDIGGNEGTWTELCKNIFPDSRIDLFEPVPQYYNKALLRLGKYKKVNCHQLACGNENSKKTFNLSGHSSSFLEVGKNILDRYPDERKTGETDVECIRLDKWLGENVKEKYPDLIKMDVEGFELNALKGLDDKIKHIHYFILELSFIERHINQPLFSEIVCYLNSNNIRPIAFARDMPLGQAVLSTDVLFKNYEL